MKAFKTFIASAIAGVMVLSMATSAFAALEVTAVDSTSKVSASGASSVVDSERTVLVVNKTAWNEATSTLSDGATIVYINQVANDELDAALADMAGKDLIHGDYVVLVGSNKGTVESDTFTAIKVEANEDGEAVDGEVAVSWNVTMNNKLVSEIVNGNVKAKFYATDLLNYVGEEKVLSWGDEAITFTGEGDFTFTAETVVTEGYGYEETTQLEISAGTVSHKG